MKGLDRKEQLLASGGGSNVKMRIAYHVYIITTSKAERSLTIQYSDTAKKTQFRWQKKQSGIQVQAMHAHQDFLRFCRLQNEGRTLI